MTVQVFSNNAKSTLASAITSTQTTITVAPGTGALFPNPSGGQQFKITLISATSSTVYEICNCTARSTDTLTIIRGQEGTTAQPFSLNDIVGHFDTAAVMTDLVQTEQLQAGTYLSATAGGTGNALTITLPSNLTSVPNGMNIIVNSSAANTGACTLLVTLGTTTLTATPIVKSNNLALTGGEIPAAGYPITLTYSTTYSAWLINNPATPSSIGYSANGYTRFSNGLILQWGQTNTTGGGTYTYQTLPIPFPNLFLSGSATFQAGNTPTSGSVGVAASSSNPLTQIEFYNSSSSSTNAIYWMVLGY